MCFAHEAVEHLLLLSRVRKLLFSRQKSNQKRRLSRVFLLWSGFRAQLTTEHYFTLLRAQNGLVVNLGSCPLLIYCLTMALDPTRSKCGG